MEDVKDSSVPYVDIVSLLDTLYQDPLVVLDKHAPERIKLIQVIPARTPNLVFFLLRLRRWKELFAKGNQCGWISKESHQLGKLLKLSEITTITR